MIKTMKRLKFLTLAVAALCCAAGCSRGPVAPKIAAVDLDTLFSHGTVDYDIRFSFASIANADRSPALAAIEEANRIYFYGLESFDGTPEEAAREAIGQFTADNDLLIDAPAEHRWEVSLHVVSEARQVDSLLVCTIVRESYQGGAHGLSTTEYHNYSLRGGYELLPGDLFDEEQLVALTGLIRAKLYERYGVTDDAGLADQGFFPEEICVTENFAVTPGGIVFYYNPYEIGCYALGGVEVAVSREGLEGLPGAAGA